MEWQRPLWFLSRCQSRDIQSNSIASCHPSGLVGCLTTPLSFNWHFWREFPQQASRFKATYWLPMSMLDIGRKRSETLLSCLKPKYHMFAHFLGILFHNSTLAMLCCYVYQCQLSYRSCEVVWIKHVKKGAKYTYYIYIYIENAFFLKMWNMWFKHVKQRANNVFLNASEGLFFSIFFWFICVLLIAFGFFVFRETFWKEVTRQWKLRLSNYEDWI
jgi:hypothetical protein